MDVIKKMILIKNIEIYNPKYIGIKDILIVKGKIALIEDKIEQFSKDINIINGKNKKLVPGFIDNHVHITGGGGEGSFSTRVPEIPLSKLIETGTTTVVGLLGTDSTTRSVENLVSKAKALKEEGISAYVYTGSYEYPSPNITGSIKRDIVFIDEVIGVKIALSDHRSSILSNEELARLASEARVGGMLAGKAGIVVAHMGDGKKGFEPINKIIKDTEIPIRTFRPTHVNRKEKLLMEAFNFAKKGGIIDLTCGSQNELRPGKVIKRAKKLKVPLENITFSSDGYGSWSNYDEKGKIIEIGASPVNSLYEEVRTMVLDLGFTLEEALIFTTTNVSKALNIYPQKGIIREGSDGDLLIINKDFELETVLAKGKLMMVEGKLLKRGTYE